MLRLRAPAKLNLYLRVLGRRPDGYHEIETVFERVDLADALTFADEPRAVTLTCTDLSAVPGTAQAGPVLSCGEDNLVLQAARRLQAESGVSRGARIHLEKRIPIAAGLGGGSSDAAATLMGLNALWELRWPRERLAELAARLGSDVPFFLIEEPFALGRGRGERCEPIPGAARLSHVLVVPPERLATRDVYAGAQFDLTAPKPSSSMVAHALRNGSLGELATGLWNDLAPEAIRRCPVIATIQAHLRDRGCLGTVVSGSGPAVVGLCADAAHAKDVAREMRARPAAPWRLEILQTDVPLRVAAPARS